MTSLSDRVEAATADQQREMLSEAWKAIHGESWQTTIYRHGSLGAEPDRAKGDVPRRFARMLDAEAYESAAMSLVPEGYSAIINTHLNSAMIALDGIWHTFHGSHAATPALALTAASLRARGL